VITATVTVGGAERAVSELELQTSRFNEAARLTARYPVGDVPAVDTTVEARINGTPVGTLTVTDASRTGEGLVELTARDAVRDLKDATLTQDFADAAPVVVVEQIADAAGVELGVIDADVGRGISPTFQAAPCAGALETVTRLTDAVWYVDADNRVRVETDPDVATHTLDELIPDTSVGTLAQPYTEVTVYGASSASAGGSDRTGGRDAQRLLSSAPPFATVGDDDGQRYVARVAQARTIEQCERYARSLLREFRRQRAEGTIVALGADAVRPLDVVRLPPLDGSPEFIASELSHRVGPQDGFITEIMPGAVV